MKDQDPRIHSDPGGKSIDEPGVVEEPVHKLGGDLPGPKKPGDRPKDPEHKKKAEEILKRELERRKRKHGK